jgi:hypothetical protein
MTWGQVFFYSLTLLILLEISERMGIPVSNIIGVPIYGAVRMLFRTGSYSTRKSIDMYRGMRRMRKRVKFHTPIMPQRAADVYGSSVRLKGLEVMAGYSRTGHPVKVDLDRWHTLVCGGTGSGKTNFVVSALVQLFSQGARFTSAYKVVIIDLKTNASEELRAFSSVAEYHHLGKHDDREKIADAMIDLAYKMSDEDGRRLLVIIDEASQVTSDLLPSKVKRMAKGAFERIASQIRTAGALVVITQNPNHKVLNTVIKANLDRRIVFRMRNNELGRTALDFTPDTDLSLLQEGEFILDDPSLRYREIIGKSFLVSIPSEIDQVLAKTVHGLAEDDVRLRTFRDHCEGLLVGSMLPGITKVANSSERTHEQLKNDRRNYANAGAVDPKTRINKTTGEVEVFGYTLACPFPEAFGKVKAYIEAGLWEDAPEKVGKSGE